MSATLNFLHVCDYAFFSEDKKLNVIGIFENISSSVFPAIHPRLSVVFNVSGVKLNDKWKVEIENPEGKVISRAEANLKVGVGEQNANLVVNFLGIPFEVAGEYRVKFYVNEFLIDGRSLPVNKIS